MMEKIVDEPWFRKWMGFSYLPINRRGWLTVLAVALVCIPCFYLFAVSEGEWRWVWGGIAASAGVLGNSLALWRTKTDYTPRPKDSRQEVDDDDDTKGLS
jgi:hypothetical protein